MGNGIATRVRFATSVGRRVALLVLLVLTVSPAAAQRYLVQNYSENDGLPSSNVYSVTQDDSGLMWFATRAGVSSYDGTDWVTYENVGTSTKNTEGFYRWDGQSHLWIVGDQFPTSINRFEGKNWTTIETPPGIEDETEITGFAVTAGESSTAAVLGLADGRYSVWDGSTWRTSSVGRDPITTLAIGGGSLFVGTPYGLGRADLDDTASLAAVPLIEQSVHGLVYDDRDGSLWFADDDGIGCLRDGRLIRLVSTPTITANHRRVVLEPDGGGGLFLGSWAEVFHFDPSYGVEQLGPRNGLFAGGTRGIKVDREGNAWIVSGRGVSKIVSFRFAGYRQDQGLLQDEVTVVLQRRSGEIVLAHPEGLTFFDPEMKTLRLAAVERRRRVLDMAEDESGRLWLADEGRGLAEVDDSGRLRFHKEVGESARSVMVDSRRGLWVATERGIWFRRDGRFEAVDVPPEMPATSTRRLIAGQDGVVYAMTAGAGVYRIDENGWRAWSTGDREADNTYALLERPSQPTLIGTREGLFQIEGDRLVVAEPRVDRPVYFLARDGAQQIWIGTDNGVLRWNGQTLRHFTIRDGLLGRETNRAAGIVDSRGQVWIGTDRGVSIYRPELDLHEPAPPIVELLDLEVSGRHLPLERSVRLSSGEHDLRFRFRAVSFLDESRVTVRAWLEGLDGEWLGAGTSSGGVIRYTHIPPGDYRFHLQAANANGVWSEIASSASIVIPAPFWTRGRFALVVLVLIIVGTATVQRHINQRRYARRLEAEIESALAERKVIEEELERARRMESLGVLAGGIAHDFNNLMTVILGNLALIRFDPHVDTDGREKLASAEAAILRARDLTQQLLTFSRGGAPVRKTASIKEIVVESASFVCSGSNVHSEVDLPDELWTVSIDTGQISQVLNNLLINAIESMPDGGVVTIRGRNREQTPQNLTPGRYLEISVEDMGPGIPEEDLARIFDPYFSTKRRGSGLGLATAYSIVKRHDGALTVDSIVGEGTTFRMLLPAAADLPADSPEPRCSVEGRGARVLVMDDEQGVREVIGALLEQFGHRLEFASNGEQAIENYRAALETGEPFDVVILDLTVRRGMGGRETIDRLRALDPGVQAIVVSGYSNDPVMADHEAYGFQSCVSKPFELQELAVAVDDIVARGRRPGTREIR